MPFDADEKSSMFEERWKEQTISKRKSEARLAKVAPECRREIARLGGIAKNKKQATHRNCDAFDLYPFKTKDV